MADYTGYVTALTTARSQSAPMLHGGLTMPDTGYATQEKLSGLISYMRKPADISSEAFSRYCKGIAGTGGKAHTLAAK